MEITGTIKGYMTQNKIYRTIRTLRGKHGEDKNNMGTRLSNKGEKIWGIVQ